MADTASRVAELQMTQAAENAALASMTRDRQHRSDAAQQRREARRAEHQARKDAKQQSKFREQHLRDKAAFYSHDFATKRREAYLAEKVSDFKIGRIIQSALGEKKGEKVFKLGRGMRKAAQEFVEKIAGFHRAQRIYKAIVRYGEQLGEDPVLSSEFVKEAVKFVKDGRKLDAAAKTSETATKAQNEIEVQMKSRPESYQRIKAVVEKQGRLLFNDGFGRDVLTPIMEQVRGRPDITDQELQTLIRQQIEQASRSNPSLLRNPIFQEFCRSGQMQGATVDGISLIAREFAKLPTVDTVANLRALDSYIAGQEKAYEGLYKLYKESAITQYVTYGKFAAGVAAGFVIGVNPMLLLGTAGAFGVNYMMGLWTNSAAIRYDRAEYVLDKAVGNTIKKKVSRSMPSTIINLVANLAEAKVAKWQGREKNEKNIMLPGDLDITSTIDKATLIRAVAVRTAINAGFGSVSSIGIGAVARLGTELFSGGSHEAAIQAIAQANTGKNGLGQTSGGFHPGGANSAESAFTKVQQMFNAAKNGTGAKAVVEKVTEQSSGTATSADATANVVTVPHGVTPSGTEYQQEAQWQQMALKDPNPINSFIDNGQADFHKSLGDLQQVGSSISQQWQERFGGSGSSGTLQSATQAGGGSSQSLDAAFQHSGTESHSFLGNLNGHDHFNQYTGNGVEGHNNSADSVLGTWQGAHTAYDQNGKWVDFYGTYPGAKEFIQIDGHYYWFEPQRMELGGNGTFELHSLDGGSQTISQDSFLHMLGYDQNSIKADAFINEKTLDWFHQHGWTGTTDASDRVGQYHDGTLFARHPGLDQTINDDTLRAAGIDPKDIHYTSVQYGIGIVKGNHMDIVAQNGYIDHSAFHGDQVIVGGPENGNGTGGNGDLFHKAWGYLLGHPYLAAGIAGGILLNSAVNANVKEHGLKAFITDIGSLREGYRAKNIVALTGLGLVGIAASFVPGGLPFVLAAGAGYLGVIAARPVVYAGVGAVKYFGRGVKSIFVDPNASSSSSSSSTSTTSSSASSSAKSAKTPKTKKGKSSSASSSSTTTPPPFTGSPVALSAIPAAVAGKGGLKSGVKTAAADALNAQGAKDVKGNDITPQLIDETHDALHTVGKNPGNTTEAEDVGTQAAKRILALPDDKQIDLTHAANAELVAAMVVPDEKNPYRKYMADHIQRVALAQQATKEAQAANPAASAENEITAALQKIKANDPSKITDAEKNPTIALRQARAIQAVMPGAGYENEIVDGFKAAGYNVPSQAVIAVGINSGDGSTRVKAGYDAVFSSIPTSDQSVEVARAIQTAFKDSGDIGKPTEIPDNVTKGLANAQYAPGTAIRARVRGELGDGARADRGTAAASYYFANGGTDVAELSKELHNMGLNSTEIKAALGIAPLSKQAEALLAIKAATGTNEQRLQKGVEKMNGSKPQELGAAMVTMFNELPGITPEEIQKVVEEIRPPLTLADRALVAREILQALSKDGTEPVPIDKLRVVVASAGLKELPPGTKLGVDDDITKTIATLGHELEAYNHTGKAGAMPDQANQIDDVAQELNTILSLGDNRSVIAEAIVKLNSSLTAQQHLDEVLRIAISINAPVAEIAEVMKKLQVSSVWGNRRIPVAELSSASSVAGRIKDLQKRAAIYSTFIETAKDTPEARAQATVTELLKSGSPTDTVNVVIGLRKAKIEDGDIAKAMVIIPSSASQAGIVQEAFRLGSSPQEKAELAALATAPKATHADIENLAALLRGNGAKPAEIRSAISILPIAIADRNDIVKDALISSRGAISIYRPPATGKSGGNRAKVVDDAKNQIVSALATSGYPDFSKLSGAQEAALKLSIVDALKNDVPATSSSPLIPGVAADIIDDAWTEVVSGKV